MEYIEINNLVPHPKNDYYFDDIIGEKWDELLMSIQTNGIHTPILVTAPDKDSNIPKHKKIIISGHQRVRACIELGIKKIPYTYKHYKSEDEIILALIESNIIQRGVGNSNPLKLGRCLNELDRIYGIKRGNNQYSNPNNLDSTKTKKSKKDIATALELTQETLTNYQKLTHLDESLQKMILSNKLSPTHGIKIAKKISKEAQKEVVKQIEDIEKVTGAVVDKVIMTISEHQKAQNKAETETKRDTPPIDKQQKSKEITLIDLEDYIKSEEGTDEDAIALSNLKLFDNEIIESFAENAHEYIDSIKYNLEELYDLLRSGNSAQEMLEELRGNNLDGALAFLKVFVLKDIEVISDSLQHIIETVENMND